LCQSRSARISKTKLLRTAFYSLVSNEAIYLERFAPKFYIYSVELELHDRNVCLAHVCYSLTRIDLSFHENHRSIWVVIIGLELLSLSCPGLGSGSDYVHHLWLRHPIITYYYGYFDPTSVENRIWVMGLELVGVISAVQGYCLV
jgi:hypothetical protein